MASVSYSLLLLLAGHCCLGHGFSGSGLLHPLTGFDHLLAMLAVGAWSAQLGGRALYVVPGCFVGMMLLGGLAGLNNLVQWGQYGELAIALSVVVLGLAIGMNRRVTGLVAGLGVGLFGFSHGLAHGLEMSRTLGAAPYVAGFLITTLGLHMIGSVGSLLLLENANGRTHLRLIGSVTMVIGFYLLIG